MTTPSTTHSVAVYGTLKRGCSNHRLLMRARYMGQDHLRQIVLYDLGPCPGARLQASQGVLVEVYEVDGATLKRLDALEGYNASNPSLGEYTRQVMETQHGPAWVYLYNKSVRGCSCIRRGSW